MNCADDATRGLHAKELSADHRWLSGPEFLYKKERTGLRRSVQNVKERSKDCPVEMAKSKYSTQLVSLERKTDMKYLGVLIDGSLLEVPQ